MRLWTSNTKLFLYHDLRAPRLYARSVCIKLGVCHLHAILCHLNRVRAFLLVFELRNQKQLITSRIWWIFSRSLKEKIKRSSQPFFFLSLSPFFHLSFHAPSPFLPLRPLAASGPNVPFAWRIRLSFTDFGDILENLRFWDVASISNKILWFRGTFNSTWLTFFSGGD